METALTGHDSPFATLRRIARKRAVAERCEMCSAGLAAEHDHLVEPANRRLICACRACAILFESQAGVKYKRIPREVLFLRDFQMTDAQWAGLLIPIEMAFFFKSSLQQKMIVLYPSPAGPMESLLSLEAWSDIERANPVLSGMHDDVVGLLINRVGYVRRTSPPEYFLVPIDECYKLVGLIRTHWRGLSGGTDVWGQIGGFFDGLKKRACVRQEGSHA